MAGELENSNHAAIGIRDATASDAPLLAELRYAFRSSVGLVNEAEADFIQRCSHWMAERLHTGSPWRCWIAEEEHKAIGTVWMQLIEKIPNPTSEPEYHAYLTNFYVIEGARGRGVGSQLLSAALNRCRSLDVHAVILWPTEQSRSLYQRHGFAVRANLMELIIGEMAAGS